MLLKIQNWEDKSHPHRISAPTYVQREQKCAIEYGAMCELGRRLKEGREAKGLELERVAELLRVRRVTLEALEECRFNDLPEPTLSRGYLKRYAKLLEIDPEPLLALYPNNLTEVPGRASKPSAPSPVSNTPVSTASPGSSRAWVIPLLLLLAVLVWVGVSFINKPKPEVAAPVSEPVTPPPAAPQQVNLRISSQPTGARVYLDGFLLGQAPLDVPVEMGSRILRLEADGYQKYEQTLTINTDRNLTVALKPSPATSPTAAVTPDSTPPATPSVTPANPKNGLVLNLVGRSWVRVVDAKTGKGLYEGIPAKGTQLSFPLPVVVRSGNAGAIEILVNGQSRGLMGKEGQVANQRYGN